ncbi:MAG TPA: cytochrome C [Gammaproteobacteria bacterium]|jgi:cytochrome c553|nr:cytochrome C [Gammaproteobacteria bacterium]
MVEMLQRSPVTIAALRLALGSLLLATLSIGSTPAAANAESDRHKRERSETVARGEYLVGLLGCGRCHTEGYLTGTEATGPLLAGSTIGIAWSGFEGAAERPGLVFARNLTPDPETGLGGWREADIVRAMRTGVSKDGHQHLPVMPSANYAMLDLDDLRAIAAYLKSLPPVVRAIPGRTEPGTEPLHPYVRFGVYRFDPDGSVSERPLP